MCQTNRMPRRGRSIVGGCVYHVLNRANARATLFADQGDYAAFEKVLVQAHQREPIRILSYIIMPNHWHLVLWPRRDEGPRLSEFMRWLTVTHTQRWHAYHGTSGTGHIYQGRFKSFPVENDGHTLRVCRYVERNPLRAGLVEAAEDWQWGSLWRRLRGGDDEKLLLSRWPIEIPHDWSQRVNRPETCAELDALRKCVQRGRPLGDRLWCQRMVKRLGLEHTIRPRGRPRKRPKG